MAKKIFRYLVEDFPKSYSTDELRWQLKMVGSDGWELVAVHDLNATQWRYVFKMEL